MKVIPERETLWAWLSKSVTVLGKVFEMFTQVDRALEKTTGGLGIGLSLVKGLIEMHGGRIEAHSEGEGRGSEFVVRLPVVLSAVQNVAPQEVDEQVISSSRRRILVADDNADSANSLGKLLELLGNDVSTANAWFSSRATWRAGSRPRVAR